MFAFITDLMRSAGTYPNVDGDETVVPVPVNPAPNTEINGVIETVGDNFRYVFNEQIVNPDGSLTVNAAHLYLLGPTAVGDLIIGQSICGVTITQVASGLSLTPEEDTNAVGTNHTLTALVTDQGGQPVAAGQDVQFDVYRSPGVTPISSTTVATDVQGEADLTYAGPATVADDTIVACIEGADVDTVCSAGDPIVDTAVKRWFSTPATATNTPADSCVRFADTTNDFVDVEAPGGGVNNRFPYDGGDQFNVDGAASVLAGFEAGVTTGDRIQVNFVPGGVSVFSLTNDTDCTPGGTVTSATITTAASPQEVEVGQAFSDLATVTGPPGGPTPTGTVTFQLFGPTSPGFPTCAEPPAATSSAIPLTPTAPGTATAGSGSFGVAPPLPPGNYVFVATYSGDANHLPSGTACADPAEQVTVEAPPTITVEKTATPSSRPEPGGAFTFDVVVTNTSAEPVTITSLTDDVYGNIATQGSCTTAIGTVLAASGGTYSCAFTGNFSGNAGATQTDIVTAVAVDDDGSQATNFDDAVVRITAVPVTDTFDCDDFTFQEDAQTVLNANPTDPHRLDADNDGRACEELPSRVLGTGASGTGRPAPVAVARTGAEFTPLAAGGAALLGFGAVLLCLSWRLLPRRPTRWAHLRPAT